MKSKSQVQLTSGFGGFRLAGFLGLVSLLLVLGLSRHEVRGQTDDGAADAQPVAAETPTPHDEDGPERPPRRPRMDFRGDDEALLRTLDEFYPEQARRLKALKERDPKEFARRAGQMRPWLRELREARTRNPELARLLVQKHQIEMAINDWQRRYRQATPEQQKDLMAEGRQLAEQRVNARLQLNRAEIQMMEKRLEGLKTRLQEREARKDAAIDRELQNMTNPPASQPAQPATDDKPARQ